MSTIRTEPSFEIPDYMKKVEWWLNKVGIGLLLFSVVFLFKYSIDQGWLTPPVRVAFGVALGIGLIVMGLRTYGKKRHFSLVFLGGGLATFYITGFAAFQILKIVSQPVAMAFMVAATALAFVLSLRQNDAILSLIGVIGGLGTPFLLYTGEGNIPGLVGYTCLILAGTVGIYFFKGWRSVLWVSVIGGWSILLIALNNMGNVQADKIAVQAGAAFAWLAFWGLPVLREVLSAKRPTRWPKSLLGFADKHLTATAKDVMDRHVHGLSVSSPLIALGISVATWSLADTDTWGWVCLGAAAVYGVTAWRLQKTESLKALAYTQGAVGTLLFTIAMYMFFEGHTLLFVMASEAVVLHLVAQRISDRIMKAGAHFLFANCSVWLLTRLLEVDYYLGGGETIGLLVDIWVIAIAFALSQLLDYLLERRVYMLFGFAALAGLLVRELDGNTLFIALTIEAIVINMTARWLKDEVIEATAHLAFAGMASWLFVRLIDPLPVGERPVLNPQSLTDLVYIAAVFVLSRTFGRLTERRVYLIAGFAALAGLLIRELDGNILLVSLTVEAIVIHFVAGRLKDRIVVLTGHLAFSLLGVWLVERMIMYGTAGRPVLNANALSDLFVITTIFGLSQTFKLIDERRVYLLAGFAALGGLLARELDGNILFCSLLAEGIALHLVARWLKDKIVIGAGHLGFAGLSFWMISRLAVARVGETAILNPQALTDLAFIAVVIALPRIFESLREKATYWLAAHVAILAWLLRELHTLPNGQGIVTATWGVYAIGLLIAGLRLNRHQLRQVALVTLLLVVGKLFLVDLAKLETIWRVLLFMGFGGIFLAISYFFQSLWKGAPEDADDSVSEETE